MAFRTSSILNEHSRERLAIRFREKFNSSEDIDALTDLLILRCTPVYIKSENVPEFITEAVKNLIKTVGAKNCRYRNR